MRRYAWIAGLAVAGLALVLVWFADREPASEPSKRALDRVGVVGADSNAQTSERSEARPDAAPVRRGVRVLDARERRRRAAVREQILVAQRARETAAASDPTPRSPTPEPEPERPPGNLNKRIDGHEALVAELNRDFMPLADECIEAALARDPELAGMLAIGFELVADEDLGAVVETVDFPEQNQIAEVELQECVRETLLSTLLPAGAEDGREALMLTLPVGTDED